jgi:regulator of sirC expression with transglutaminase-like and TPR domain
LAIKRRFDGFYPPAQEIRIFRRVVFQEFGIFARQEPLNKRFTLTNTLLRRGGSCLGLTTLYVCAAEMLGLLMRPMLFEGHIAVGHAAVSPPLHIEPMKYGTFLPLKTSLLFRGESADADGELLTNRQFLAVHFSNHAAFVLVPENRLDDASFLLDEAVKLFPHYKAAWINKALVSLKQGKRMLAEECLGRVIALKPGPCYRSVVDHVISQIEEGDLRGKELEQQLVG